MTSRYCSQCGKARKACICDSIQSLDSGLELIILQHPTEEHRPMGTARILTLSLMNCHHFIGEDFSRHDELNQLLCEDEVDHFVLYPGDRALSVTEYQNQANPAYKQRAILLDGTWKKAYKMWQLSTNLHNLPAVRLPGEINGNYRIRKAPNDNALSTVEAGYHLLSLWQPESDFTPLLVAFEQMIDFQIAQMPAGVFERNYLKPDN